MERQKNHDVSNVSEAYLVSTSPKRNPEWTLKFFLAKRLGAKFHVEEGRKVALIIDNCPAHPSVETLFEISVIQSKF